MHPSSRRACIAEPEGFGRLDAHASWARVEYGLDGFAFGLPEALGLATAHRGRSADDA